MGRVERQFQEKQDLALFKQRLVDTIRFYYHPEGAAQDIRSLFDKPMFSIYDPLTYRDATDEEIRENLLYVHEKRRRKLAAANIDQFSTGSSILAGGRLGYLNPASNLVDGAADVVSNWFFDLNEPGWSTWVDFVTEADNSLLVFWTPPEHIEGVELGIEANPEACIGWLEEFKHVFGIKQTPYLDQITEMTKNS